MYLGKCFILQYDFFNNFYIGGILNKQFLEIFHNFFSRSCTCPSKVVVKCTAFSMPCITNIEVHISMHHKVRGIERHMFYFTCTTERVFIVTCRRIEAGMQQFKFNQQNKLFFSGAIQIFS